MEMKTEDTDLNIFHQNVLHTRQSYKWDCGIACVKMVLSCRPAASTALSTKTFAEQLGDISRNPLTNFEKRPWTIDLCNILYRLQVNFMYFTTSKQVAETLSSIRFYSRNFKKDKNRIDALFKTSPMHSRIIEKSLSTAELVVLLKSGPLILLINSYKLRCYVCRVEDDLPNKLLLGCCGLLEPPFAGHYIVLVGYRKASGFLYRNPALREELCCIQDDDLDKARRSRGTDEDVVAVNLHGSSRDDDDGGKKVEPLPSTSQQLD